MIEPFWIYLACFVVMLACAPAAEWFAIRGYKAAAIPILIVGLVGALAIFGKGALMVVAWSNPFAGQEAEVARVIHNPRTGVVVALLTIWPFALMALSGFFCFSIAIVLKRHVKISS